MTLILSHKRPAISDAGNAAKPTIIWKLPSVLAWSPGAASSDTMVLCTVSIAPKWSLYSTKGITIASELWKEINKMQAQSYKKKDSSKTDLRLVLSANFSNGRDAAML